jgi:hypothetical protein
MAQRISTIITDDLTGAARKTGRGSATSSTPSCEQSAARAWLVEQGVDVPTRGRLSAEMLERYRARWNHGGNGPISSIPTSDRRSVRPHRRDGSDDTVLELAEGAADVEAAEVARREPEETAATPLRWDAVKAQPGLHWVARATSNPRTLRQLMATILAISAPLFIGMVIQPGTVALAALGFAPYVAASALVVAAVARAGDLAQGVATAAQGLLIGVIVMVIATAIFRLLSRAAGDG